MKATGIVRKVDELGRIVIPKELRNTLGIEIKDPLEIFTTDNGEIILKKYDMRKNASEKISDLISYIYDTKNLSAEQQAKVAGLLYEAQSAIEGDKPC